MCGNLDDAALEIKGYLSNDSDQQCHISHQPLGLYEFFLPGNLTRYSIKFACIV
jgi:hypothetical protein